MYYTISLDINFERIKRHFHYNIRFSKRITPRMYVWNEQTVSSQLGSHLLYPEAQHLQKYFSLFLMHFIGLKCAERIDKHKG